LTATTTAGTHISYTWNLGDGTPLVLDASALAHTYGAVGDYGVALTATNNAGHLVTHTTVVVVDEPVTGLALAHDGPTPLGSTTSFSASIETGTHVTYAWDLGDGALGATRHLTHTYDEPGAYTIVLTATNSQGMQAVTDTLVVHDVPIQGLRIHHDAPTPLGYPTSLAASVDQGSHITYRWDLGDGTRRSTKNLLYTYATPGTYTATVTATNGWNDQTTTAAIRVYQPDEPIQGLSIANDGPTFLGDATHFALSMTSGTNVSLLWDLGDGNTSTERDPVHTYATVGEYTIVLTATNSWGKLVRHDTATVRDVPISGLSLQHDGPTMLGHSTMLSASVINGTHVAYNWDLGDGQTQSGAHLIHTYAAPGTYQVTVTALNGTNETEASATVNVLDPGYTVCLALVLKP
jgi:PKD repeat protein